MDDFFISYNKADKHWAQGLGDWLDQAGYSTIMQEQDFVASSNFVAEMHKAVESAKRMIMVLSPDYLLAKFPLAEWTSVFVTDPTCEVGRLVPVRIRECEPTGLLRPIVYIDLVGLTPDTARQKFLSEIEAVVSGARRIAPGTSGTPESRAPKQKKTRSIVQRNTINSSGADATNIIAPNATIKVQGRKRPKIQPVDTIGSDPYMKAYVAYLIKQYNDFAVIGRKSYGQKTGFHFSVIHRIIKSSYGATTYEVLQTRFDKLVEDLQSRIDKTIQGRRNKSSSIPNYHSYETHRRIMDGEEEG